jgi:hypothetical protein
MFKKGQRITFLVGSKEIIGTFVSEREFCNETYIEIKDGSSLNNFSYINAYDISKFECEPIPQTQDELNLQQLKDYNILDNDGNLQKEYKSKTFSIPEQTKVVEEAPAIPKEITQDSIADRNKIIRENLAKKLKNTSNNTIKVQYGYPGVQQYPKK